MRILALDLSKRSAGWACWGPSDEHVASGTWELGSEFTGKGQTFAKLHQNMADLHRLGAIDRIYYEKPLNLGPAAGNTSRDTLDVLIGLAMHAESFGFAMSIPTQDLNMSSWRAFFLAGMKKANATADLKEYAMRRCRQLGFRPIKHDQAEAIGILDYALELNKIMPPWRSGEVLRSSLDMAS
jgi:hypothetical protein